MGLTAILHKYQKYMKQNKYKPVCLIRAVNVPDPAESLSRFQCPFSMNPSQPISEASLPDSSFHDPVNLNQQPQNMNIQILNNSNFYHSKKFLLLLLNETAFQELTSG